SCFDTDAPFFIHRAKKVDQVVAVRIGEKKLGGLLGPSQEIKGAVLTFKLVDSTEQFELFGCLPTRFNDDAEKCLDGSKARRIGNMEHHTFTQRSLMLVEARFEASGADPEPVNFSEPCSELVGFEVGRTHQLKWSRGATA